MNTELDFISRPSNADSQTASPLLVLFHGYGANMHDLMGLADIVDPRLEVVAAQAPIDLSSAGMPGGRAWFHLHQDERGEISYDEPSARASIEIASEFIRDLSTKSESPPPGVLAMGFSQGAMISHALLLQGKAELDGIAACSGRLVEGMLTETDDVRDRIAEDLPVLLTHGTLDPLIPIANGHALKELYAETPAQLTWVEEPIGHGIGPRSAEALSMWSTTAVERILNR